MKLNEVIEDYDGWVRSNQNFTWFDYLGLKCDLYQSLSFSKLYFPEVCLYDGWFFFRDSCLWNDFQTVWETAKTAADVEKWINFISIGDLFGGNEKEPYSMESTRVMVEILKYSWTLHFEKSYSGYDLAIETFDNELDGWRIRVYQKKNINRKKPEKMPDMNDILSYGL